MKNHLKWIIPTLFMLAICPNLTNASEKKTVRFEYAFEQILLNDTLQQKANINTSRSNIKHHRQASDIGVNEPGVNRKDANRGSGALPAEPASKKEKSTDKKK
jgi:hypothetical protein